jgi:type IX secretion system PorP/SprF family membrane protein
MKKIFASILTITALQAGAQDAQLSQIFNAPLLLNPAETGLMDKGWRVSGGYRNTNFSGGMKAFSTGYLSVDTRLKGKWIPEGDRFGIGAYGYLDQSLSGALKANYFGLSLAYNKALSAGGKTRLGVGAQAVYASRQLNTNKLTFEDQFTSGGFSSVPSRDASRGGTESHFDLNAGLELTHEAARWGVAVGGAVKHINRPKESFWGDDYQLPMSYSANGQVYVKLKGGDKLTVQALYVTGGPQQYLQGGLVFSKSIKLSATETTLDLGVLGRDSRTIIPYLGLGYGRTKGAITYDVTTNKEKQAGLSRSSLEVMLTHSF